MSYPISVCPIQEMILLLDSHAARMWVPRPCCTRMGIYCELQDGLGHDFCSAKTSLCDRRVYVQVTDVLTGGGD